MSGETTPPDLPAPVIGGRRRHDAMLIWLVPLVAAIAAIVLMVRGYFATGPTITISFLTAEGINESTTTVKYKNVVVGTVEKIRLDEESGGVTVSVVLTRDAARFAVEDTRFWVERPRVDLGGISGLGTLLSGAYIGMDVGTSEESKDEFIGLEGPPAITKMQKGLRIQLSSYTLASLNIGSPIYFRQLQVGRVVGYELDTDGSAVTLQAFIDAPYDRYVNAGTRFWNISGVNVTLGANGLEVNSQSLLSLLAGGIAFEPGAQNSGQVEQDTRFLLYSSKAISEPAPEGPSAVVRMRFFQSVRGLFAGAPVEINGMQVGEVTDIGLEYDTTQRKVYAEVHAEIFTSRLGPVYAKLKPKNSTLNDAEATMRRLLEYGLRAQLRSGSLVTGQMYVALELPEKTQNLAAQTEGEYLEIVTVPGGVDEVIAQIGELVQKLNTMPFAEIGKNLSSTLGSADRLLLKLDTELAPEAKATLSEVRATLGSVRGNLDAPPGSVIHGAQQTLDEVGRAARSLRHLSDYLQRHPEALINGKDDEPTRPTEEQP